MVKVKRKVEMNLPQLIEWGQDNIEEATKKVYRVNENEVLGDHVRFTEVNSDLQVRLHGYIPFDTTFTVEVEEQIDENTKLIALVELSSQGLLGNTRLYRYHSINDVIDNQSVAFYILNDDQTMDLIWKNGRLVE